jgi:hypothetical protein
MTTRRWCRLLDRPETTEIVDTTDLPEFAIADDYVDRRGIKGTFYVEVALTDAFELPAVWRVRRVFPGVLVGEEINRAQALDEIARHLR